MHDDRVQLRGLDDAGSGRSDEVLLLLLARLGVLVVEDEVDLVGVAALVGSEHDDVRGRVGELLLVEGRISPFDTAMAKIWAISWARVR
jgi:hypothetical protein